MLLNPERALKHLGIGLRAHSDSAGLGWSLRCCLSSSLAGDADSAGPATSLEQQRQGSALFADLFLCPIPSPVGYMKTEQMTEHLYDWSLPPIRTFLNFGSFSRIFFLYVCNCSEFILEVQGTFKITHFYIPAFVCSDCVGSVALL